MNRLDHLVIAAETLQQGVDYIRSTLAVEIPAGGTHKTMGTHNHLMQLGNDAYIEVIAINPQAAAPRHPRWFNLDDALMRASLHRQPRLITWVVNTPDIKAVEHDSVLPIGIPTELSRDALRWQVGLTEDGRLLANGLVPYLIQWHTEPHPSGSMADMGCRLQSLEIYHNRPDWLHSVLTSMGAGHLVSIHSLPDTEAPFLSANIETPSGIVNINSNQE
ncbi:MAG: VOC family protein [Gammaproteobacteria bacterium]|nr:MAG: VOC family protein [Gammaproteobacteria bacterium]